MRRPQMKKAREHARDLISRYNIAQPPVPIEKISKYLGLNVKYSKLDEEISGMIYFRNGITIVWINSLHHPNRQRFTLAHECAHYVLHRERILDAVHIDKRYEGLLRSDISSRGVDPIEIEANQFAAELLVPENILIGQLEGLIDDIEDDLFVSRLAKKFKVSSQMMSNRLANVRTH
jgi:Zn-dependent peptidase ImmA (M78 family)